MTIIKADCKVCVYSDVDCLAIGKCSEIFRPKHRDLVPKCKQCNDYDRQSTSGFYTPGCKHTHYCNQLGRKLTANEASISPKDCPKRSGLQMKLDNI